MSNKEPRKPYFSKKGKSDDFDYWQFQKKSSFYFVVILLALIGLYHLYGWFGF